MSFPLGEESISAEPVDWGVTGPWVEAGESSDIGDGGRCNSVIAEEDDPIGARQVDTTVNVRGINKVENERIVGWMMGENEEEAQDVARTRTLTDMTKSVHKDRRLSNFQKNVEQSKKFDFTRYIAGTRRIIGMRWKHTDESGRQL